MTQEQAIEAVEDADISTSGWLDVIIEQISDKYAQGYLTCFLENLSGRLSATYEEYREEVLEALEYDIWGK